MSEAFDHLYGSKGIDTAYERDLVSYRPNIKYKKEQLSQIIRPEVQQSIERAKTFTISQNLEEYDELIAEIEQMMKDIASRNSKTLIDRLKERLSQKLYKEVMSFESEQSGYSQTGDYELYSLLYNMKASMETRRDFIDDRFRTQITSETDLAEIQAAEAQGIEEWEQLEARTMEGYRLMTNHDEDHAGAFDDDSLVTNLDHLSYEELERIEKKKRNREIFHTSLADTSYVHRNRYFLFLDIVEKAKILVYESNQLIDKNLKEFILSLSDLASISSAKAHLILTFKKMKDKHEALKGRMMTIDDEKESFASEKQYMYQQLETKSIEPIKEWLYAQESEISGALDIFSEYMVDSMSESRNSYESSLSDMLNFYKSEADFYGQQIYFLKNKEEIRKFYRILEDLEDVEQIHGEWVEEYLKTNGYTP